MSYEKYNYFITGHFNKSGYARVLGPVTDTRILLTSSSTAEVQLGSHNITADKSVRIALRTAISISCF